MSEELRKYWDQFVSGDKGAFGKVYEHYRPLLTFYCIGLLQDTAIAENCSSEALIKVYDHDHPDEIRDLEHWLFSVAKNLCISQLRQRNNRGAILNRIGRETSSAQKSEIELQQNAESIDQIIKENLNEIECKLWQLHTEGFSNKEISSKLNINEKTVANRKSEIRNRLKLLVSKHLQS